jgi:plastocyanin
MLAMILAVLSAACTAPSGTPAPTGTPAAGGENAILIQNFAFSPATLTVKAGTAVTWTNRDGADHTITADPGAPAGFGSGNLASGASYSFTFTSPGTYTYHCSIHPSMKGTIVVA